jgi:hypothetical protein
MLMMAEFGVRSQGTIGRRRQEWPCEINVISSLFLKPSSPCGALGATTETWRIPDDPENLVPSNINSWQMLKNSSSLEMWCIKPWAFILVQFVTAEAC